MTYRVTCLYPDGEIARVVYIKADSRDGVDRIMTDTGNPKSWPWGWMTEEVKSNGRD